MTRQDYIAREQEASELRAQDLQAYRDALMADCVHGRRRTIHGHGQDMKAGYECKAGRCGFRAIGPLQLAREWKAADPG